MCTITMGPTNRIINQNLAHTNLYHEEQYDLTQSI